MNVLGNGIYRFAEAARLTGLNPRRVRAWFEGWTESGKVVGREIVTIVPQSDISKVQKDTPPHANSAKVETLKGGDYMRLWISKGGNFYLVHFPTA